MLQDDQHYVSSHDPEDIQRFLENDTKSLQITFTQEPENGSVSLALAVDWKGDARTIRIMKLKVAEAGGVTVANTRPIN